jgi:CRP-like cAMP-binding protein
VAPPSRHYITRGETKNTAYPSIPPAKRGDFISSKGLTYIAAGVALSVQSTDTKRETIISAAVYQEGDWFGGYGVFHGTIDLEAAEALTGVCAAFTTISTTTA